MRRHRKLDGRLTWILFQVWEERPTLEIVGPVMRVHLPQIFDTCPSARSLAGIAPIANARNSRQGADSRGVRQPLKPPSQKVGLSSGNERLCPTELG